MIILRQNTFSKIGELRNRAIRDKAARMIKTTNKNLKDARNKMIQETTDKTHKILLSNNPEKGKNRRLEMLYDNRKRKSDLLDKKEGVIEKAISEFQEKFPKRSSISRDEYKTGKKILDRYKRENVIMNKKQKNYSRKKDQEEFDKETDRVAEELSKEVRKLPKKDQKFAGYLYKSGGDMANKAKYNDEILFRLPGRIIGSVAGYKVGKNLAEKHEKKHPGLIGAASGYAGGLVLAKAGQMIGQKHSDNVGREKIRGNEEDVRNYMKMSPKERREFEKNYDPNDYYFWDSLTKDDVKKFKKERGRYNESKNTNKK